MIRTKWTTFQGLLRKSSQEGSDEKRCPLKVIPTALVLRIDTDVRKP